MENNTGYINYMLILKLIEFFKRKKNTGYSLLNPSSHNKLFPSLLWYLQ